MAFNQAQNTITAFIEKISIPYGYLIIISIPLVLTYKFNEINPAYVVYAIIFFYKSFEKANRKLKCTVPLYLRDYSMCSLSVAQVRSAVSMSRLASTRSNFSLRGKSHHGVAQHAKAALFGACKVHDLPRPKYILGLTSTACDEVTRR